MPNISVQAAAEDLHKITLRAALFGLATLPAVGATATAEPENPMTLPGPETSWQRAKVLMDALAAVLDECDGGNWQAIINPVSRGPAALAQLGAQDAVEYHAHALRRALQVKYPGKWTFHDGPMDDFADRVGSYAIVYTNRGRVA